MKKLLVCAILVLFSVFGVSANQGVMSGTQKLRVTQTEYFDIIYAEKNAVTAQILYEHADDIYRELAASYGTDPYFRLPIVITSTVEQFNAYFSFFPFNHIVLYDTAIIPDLAVFSQTVTSTFTHELTHALTYNHKNKVNRFFSKLFGDAWAAHYLTVTSGMAEGATVSYESSKGEGRLNDPYALQMIRQAKIENKFPSYSDVKGAADSYPRNTFYYFNGGFAQFLQTSFGMDKYAEFWYRCVNGKNITAAGAFKKTFGVKLKHAWKLYEESFYVPEVQSSNPVQAGQVKDLFVPQTAKYSIKNDAGSLYSDLCVTPQGIYYIDETSSSVFFVEHAQLKSGSAVSAKKVFHQDYIDSIRVSNDGRFMAVGYYSTMSSNYKHKAKLYDLQNKKWINIEETSIVSPGVLESQGKYYFVYQKYEPQCYSLCIDAVSEQGTVEHVAALPFEPECVPGDFTDLGDGRFAFIKKAELEFSICVATIDLTQITQYTLPEQGMRLRNLSAAPAAGKLAFSWATKDTLPRAGILDLEQGTFALAQENISGGVYYPVFAGDEEIVYVGQFFRQNRLLRMELASQEFAVSVAEPVQAAENINTPGAQLPVVDLPYKMFSPWKYAFQGFLFPVSIAQARNFMNYGSTDAYYAPYGFTYITSLPWTTGLFLMTGGYGTQTESGVFQFEYQGGTGTSLFVYDIAATTEFDEHGFKQVYGAFTGSSGFDFGQRSAFMVSAAADASYGRFSYTGAKGKVINYNDDVYFKTREQLAATYSNAVFSGPGTYERSGFSLSAGLIHNYSSKVKPKQEKIMGIFDVGFGLMTYIPKLIPVTCKDNFTYNLPSKLKASLFSLNDSEFSAASVNAETVLFGYDIQKAIPFLSALYINDVIVTLQYTGGLDYADSQDYGVNWHLVHIDKYAKQAVKGELKFRDYGTVKVSLGFTPNVGIFATNQFRNNFYLSYSFGKKENLPRQVFNVGLEAHF